MSNHGWLISILSHALACALLLWAVRSAFPAPDAALESGTQGMSPLHLQVPPDVVVSSGASLDPASTGSGTVASDCSPRVLDTRRSAWINEIHYDNDGLDRGEFVEIAGVEGTDLSRWRLILYNGESGQAYGTVYLSGVIPGEACGFGALAFSTPGLQNGAVSGFTQGDGIALALDPWDQVVQFISYEGSFTAMGGVAAGLTSTEIGVAETDTTPFASSLQISGNVGAFVWGGPAQSSPGQINAGQTFAPCSGAVVLSYRDTFTPGACARHGTVTRTWTARDSCGNTASLPQTITIRDGDPPEFTTVPGDIAIGCDQHVDPENTGGFAIAADSGDWMFGLSGAWINEFHYDDSESAPDADFVEIAGVHGTDLTGYALAFYTSSGMRYGGMQYLSGRIAQEGACGYGALVFRPRAATGIGLQNGPADGIALVHLPTEQVIQFVSYEGTLTALNGPAAGSGSADAGVAEGGSTPPGASIHLTGAGNNWRAFAWNSAPVNSPGMLNPGQSFVPCGAGTVVTFADLEAPGNSDAGVLKTIDRTWTATDICGNSRLHTQIITIQDTTPPSLTPPGSCVVEGCGQSSITGLAYSEVAVSVSLAQLQAVGGDAWDACGIVSISYEDRIEGVCPLVVKRTFAVSDAGGHTTSQTQEIAVKEPDLQIVAQPVDHTVCTGKQVTLEVDIVACEPCLYQWRKDGVPIAGATEAALQLNAVSAADAGLYDVVVNGSCGSLRSRAAALTLHEGLAIILEPESQAACPGADVSFRAEATGSGLSYQWRKDGLPIAGATEAALQLNAVSATDAGLYDVVVNGSCGSLASRAAALTLHEGLAMILEPESQVACPGAGVSFRVEATGSGLSYQWRKDGLPIAGATEAALQLNAVSAADAGLYDVVVKGSCEGLTSRAAALTLHDGLAIILEPESQIVCPGADVSFRVEATGSGLSYQWRKDGLPIAGATEAALQLNAVSAADAGLFDVVVNGSCGSLASRAAALTLHDRLVIILEPESQIVCPGADVSFRAEATGSGMSYQWRKDGLPIAGATEAALQLKAVSATDAGLYDVMVNGSCGSLTSRAAALTLHDGLGIILEPESQILCPGADASFRVEATGSGLSYQWRKDGLPIAGATEAALQLNAVSAADASLYDVVVNGTCGSLTSRTAALTLHEGLAIILEPESQVACPGAGVSFRVEATGSGLSYQWRKDGLPIAGATEAALQLNAVSAADASLYDVVVNGTCGSLTSRTAALTLHERLAIILEPESQIVCPGAGVSFQTEATGSGLSYQWRKEGLPIAGATEAALQLNAVRAADAGLYDVVVNGSCGSLTSRAAALTLHDGLAIILEPESRTVCPEIDVSFRAEATGSGLSYQWRKDGLPIAGATEAALQLNAVSAADAGLYDVVVNGSCGSLTSRAAALTLLASTPEIIRCPPDVTLTPIGDAVVLPDMIREVVATDDCTPASLLEVAQSPPAGTLLPAGETVVTFTVRNGSGGVATCQSKVVVPEIGPAPVLSISDATVFEGDSGAADASFTVFLSAPSVREIAVNYSTGSTAGIGAATPGIDYIESEATLVFLPRQASKSIQVRPRGDRLLGANDLLAMQCGELGPAAMNGIALRFARSGSNFRASWTARPGKYELQERHSLSEHFVWRKVDAPVSVSESEWSVAVPNANETTFYRLVCEGQSGSEELSQSLAIQIVSDVVCEPDERFFVTLSAPVNATIGKGQGVGTIKDDDCLNLPADVAIIPNLAYSEVFVVEEYLAGAGLTSRVFDRQSVTLRELAACKLVIWNDPGPPADGLREEEAALLLNVFDAGIPLYLIGERVAASAESLAEPVRSWWTSLVGLSAAAGLGGDEWVTILAETGHHVINGGFGFVEDFEYSPAMEEAIQTGPDHITVARSGSADVVLARQDPATGVRSVTQNILLAIGLNSAASTEERRRLFLNAVWWLLRKPVCGLTDLAISQSASPNPAVAGSALTFVLTVQRTGECDATEVIVRDVLPEDATFVSAHTPQGTWSEAEGVVTFNLGAFEDTALELRVTVLPTAPGELSNTVKVRGDERDPNLRNNASSIDVPAQFEH